MVKKEIFLALMVVSIFLISACDVYDTLYIQQTGGGEVVEVSEEDIIIDIDTIEEGEEVTEEGVEGETVIDEEIDSIEEEVEIIMVEEEDEIPEDATVMIVEETELVSLVPKAEDPDQDTLTFTFTSPTDDNGEWQTTYGDAGEYTVTVTASDGLLTANKEVLIIVNRKEESPVLDSFKPQETAIEIGETESIGFEVDVSDLNDDVLRYSWKLDGVEIGDESSAEYQTTYEDSGSHTVKVTVSDGIFDTEKIWSVTVSNVNRKPLLTEVHNVEASETDTVVIELEAWDDDEDDISYTINDERFAQDENVFTWETTYDDAGEHVVTVSVSDGVDTTSQDVTITIENVNRAPVILDIVQK
jgi:hypothetical protein